MAMAFIGTAIAGLGSSIASIGGPIATGIGSALSWAGGGIGSLFTSSASTAASAGSAAASSGGFLGLGSGFWTAVGVGASVLGMVNTIQTNNAMARETVFDTMVQGEASALDFQRRRADAKRESDRETARRTSLLAAQGGLTDGADLVLESLLEGARADERMVTDMGFEQGAISRRIANTMRGARRQNIGALIQGGARITDLLSR